MTRHIVILSAALALLSACASSTRISDSRAQTLLSYAGPEHYAERSVAKDLASRCNRYSYDVKLAEAMSEAREASGASLSSAQRGAIQLETGVKQRSLASYYGQSNYSALNPCETLDQEVARMSPLSVMVVKKG